MKGIGILLIMVHNYVDHLMDINCNEMHYSQEVSDIFLSNIFTSSFFWYILSFAGWIGVPIFIFLSGYGLTKKYGTSRIEVPLYIRSHLIKLWKLLLPIYLLYVIISHCCFGQNYLIKGILTVCTFTANFYGDNYLEPGVYWFFGVILQFYIIFLLLRKLSVRWLCALLVGFLVIHYVALYFMSEWSMVWVRHNFTGWGASFILGIIAARKDIHLPKHYEWAISLLSFCFLWVCMTIKPLTPFAELTSIVFIISLGQKFTFKPFEFIGLISASIFVVHPLIRMIFYHTISLPHGQTSQPIIMTLAYFLIVILVSLGHHILLKSTSAHKRQKIN